MCTTRRIRFNGYPAVAGIDRPTANARGSALIIVLVILMVLTLLGQIATRTTNTEVKIAANDKRNRVVFYNADGATELASELLEQNIDTLGFDDGTLNFNTGTNVLADFIGIEVPDFWRNEDDFAVTPNDGERDFFLPADYSAGEPHTNFTLGGHPEFSEGAGIPMAAGYEGMGKGTAHGGTKNIFEIITQHVGEKNAESIVRIRWRHVN